jgi:DNA topoisomerase-1
MPKDSAPDKPGITRRRAGKHWRYFSPRGREIVKLSEVERLNKIGLPPAYTQAWLSPDPDSPIQATGNDRRGRRQYRYHPDFRAGQDADKFDRCIEFGRRLPRLRAQVEHDLAGDPFDRATVIAAVIRVLDECRMRVGNRAYTRANNSFGATTLLRRHVTIGLGRIVFKFMSKAGKTQRLELRDERVIAIVRKLAALPGRAVFQYRDPDGTICRVTPSNINQYIQQVIGSDFSTKYFRTWHGSASAMREAMRLMKRGHRPTIKELAGPVSAELGNTPAIARKSYIHPDVLEAASRGNLPGPARPTKWLDREEIALLTLEQD